MKSSRAIHVTQVRNLEINDLFAYEFLGSVLSGRITAVCHTGHDLTEIERNYMHANSLVIPHNKDVTLAGHSSVIIFFAEQLFGEEPRLQNLYLELDEVVAVLENSRPDRPNPFVKSEKTE